MESLRERNKFRMRWILTFHVMIRLGCRAARSDNRLPAFGRNLNASSAASILHRVQTSSEAHPAFYGKKAAVSSNGQLSPARADIKNEWMYTATPPCDFMAFTETT